MNDVDLLREAATKMRERAEGAQYRPGRWAVDVAVLTNTFPLLGPSYDALAATWKQAEHIASWRPAVALADADLMWRLAQCWDALPEYVRYAAVAKARAYLDGEAP